MRGAALTSTTEPQPLLPERLVAASKQGWQEKGCFEVLLFQYCLSSFPWYKCPTGTSPPSAKGQRPAMLLLSLAGLPWPRTRPSQEAMRARCQLRSGRLSPWPPALTDPSESE